MDFSVIVHFIVVQYCMFFPVFVKTIFKSFDSQFLTPTRCSDSLFISLMSSCGEHVCLYVLLTYRSSLSFMSINLFMLILQKVIALEFSNYLKIQFSRQFFLAVFVDD